MRKVTVKSKKDSPAGLDTLQTNHSELAMGGGSCDSCCGSDIFSHCTPAVRGGNKSEREKSHTKVVVEKTALVWVEPED